MPPRSPQRRQQRFSPRARALAALLLITSLWPACITHCYNWRAWYLRTIPDRMVIRHAEGTAGALAKEAFAEWIHRYQAHLLTDADRDRLFDYLLAWQGDLSRPWDTGMGDILLAAAMSHRLSPDREDRFAVNSYVIQSLLVRPAIRPGDPVAIEYTGVKRGCNFQTQYVDCAITGSFRRTPSKPDWVAMATLGVAGDVHRGEIAACDAGTQNLMPGRARLHLVLDHSYRYRGRCAGDSYERSAQTRREIDVTVVPRGTRLGTPVPDPVVADAVARSVKLGVYRAPSGQLYAQVRLDPAPVDRAFDVRVNSSRPQLVTQRFAPAKESDVLIDESNCEELVPIDVPKDQKSIDIQVVGSGDALRHSARLKTYWSGSISCTVPITTYSYLRSPPAGSYVITPGR